SAVNKILHPEDNVFNQSFETMAVESPDNHFDSVIGNIPFGSARGASAHDDPDHKNEKLIERYFINRLIDKVKPSGLLVLVVPVNIVRERGKAWQKWRAKISKKAEFLGAHKLPSKTFGKQGT
ncbi:Eco57I restriction-modification methylase domain-containing protein, partial [Vibrio sp. 10N.261.48.A2]